MSKRGKSTNPRSDRKINDWELKRKSFQTLFGVLSDREIATAILGYNRDDLKDAVKQREVEDLRGSFKSWYTVRPTGATGRKFVAQLTLRLKKMGCEHPNITGIIVDGTYADFCDMIPEERRKGLPKPPRPDHWEEVNLLADGEELHPLWFPRTAMIETAREGLAKGKIDQKLHYLIPDAVENWKAIVDSGEYRQYEECKESLITLVNDEVWRRCLRSGTFDGIVTLGSGSPTKDQILIESLLDEVPGNELVYYALVDFSGYMLESSYRIVDSALRRAKKRNRVKLLPVRWDFMDLAGVQTLLHRPNKNVAWTIPGGTIGNLNERQLFRSVAQQARPGDIFVVGAETLSVVGREKKQPNFKHKYETSAIRRFVEAPLRSAWHDVGLRGDIKKVAEKIDIEVVDGFSSGHSTVEDAKTVEVSINLDKKRKIVLLTSTRYREDKLIELARREGFVHEGSVSSPLPKSAYKQIVFRFHGRIIS